MKKHHLKSNFGQRMRVLSAVIVGLFMFMIFAQVHPILGFIALIASISLPFIWKESGILATGGAGGEKTDAEKAADLLMQKVKDHFAQEKFMTEDAFKKQYDLLIKDFIEKNGIDKLPNALVELTKLAAKVNALGEQRAGNSNAHKSIKEQITETLEKHKDKWAAFKAGESKEFSFDITFKTAGTMTNSGNLNSSAYLPQFEMTPGYVALVRNRPFLENFINSSSTSKATIIWVNQVNADGNAGFIGEGIVKPLIDFEFQTETSNAKKVADKIKVSTEMLDDIDFVEAAIRNELKYKVDIKVDAELLTGSGGTSLDGVTSFASAFTIITITTTSPQNADAIRAAIAQIVSLNFMPTYCFVNPIDAANMDLNKTTQGEYTLPPFTTPDGRTIAGVKVVETNQMPQGHFLLGDTSTYIKRDYINMKITMGYVNDDFELNLVTFIGERRLHAYMSDNNTGSWIYDTFDNVKTAITAAP